MPGSRLATLSITRWLRLPLVLSAIVAAALLATHDARPAAATADAKIFVSESSGAPIPVSTVILTVGGDPQTLYIWAENVTDGYGASAFELGYTYPGAIVTVVAMTEQETWLESTGRSMSCGQPVWDSVPPYTRPIPDDPDGMWEGILRCSTLNPPPPQGPFGPNCGNGHCSGVLATITLQAAGDPGSAVFDFAGGSFLLNTEFTSPPTEIPTKVSNVTGRVAICADVNGSGSVNIFDMVGIASKFGTNSSQQGWDPAFDLDLSGAVNIFDLVLAALQFTDSCYQV